MRLIEISPNLSPTMGRLEYPRKNMLKTFEISRMTTHNGPGFRTLVHFKGCPMRCRWCSTPESISRDDELGYKAISCIGDGACIGNCHVQAIEPAADRAMKVNIIRNRCMRCFTCTSVCYAHALVKIGHDWTVDGLYQEILKDEAFFKHSDGGVTFSGGEPLMHMDDDMVVLYQLLFEAGISICVDTSGFVRWENIERVLPYVKYFLWDLKYMDATQHKSLTGKDNSIILDNLGKVAATSLQYGTQIFIRCVQVPGMTDTDENLHDTCRFLLALDYRDCIVEVGLVNFHHLGKKRYEYLDLEYPMEGIDPLGIDEMQNKCNLLRSYGFNARSYM